jgi:Ser/Thr protein kinase RdoA (MazF antagonist)
MVNEERARAAEAKLGGLGVKAQVAWLRRLGREALRGYGLESARMGLLNHGENATFRVERGGERWVLRIHREGYQTEATIRSELAWLAALARDEAEALTVPAPVVDGDGQTLRRVQEGDGGLARFCVLFRWVDGRFSVKRRGQGRWRGVGRALGALHRHATHWERPQGFERQRWDVEGLMGLERPLWGAPEGPLAAMGAQRAALADLVTRGREVARARLLALPTDGHIGLIHADLHAGNVLFEGSRANVIDFDDCGWGYWVHDLVIAVGAQRWRPGFERVLEAVLAGYAEEHPVSTLELRLLEPLLAARFICGLSWILDRAATNPRLHAYIERACAQAQDGLSAYLGWEEGRA